MVSWLSVEDPVPPKSDAMIRIIPIPSFIILSLMLVIFVINVGNYYSTKIVVLQVVTITTLSATLTSLTGVICVVKTF